MQFLVTCRLAKWAKSLNEKKKKECAGFVFPNKMRTFAPLFANNLINKQL